MGRLLGVLGSPRSSRNTRAACAGMAALVALAAAPAAAAAPAQSTCFVDAAGDDIVDDPSGAPAHTPQADIVEYCASYQATSASFTLTVAQPTDPYTDPKRMTAVWELHVDGDRRADFQVFFTTYEGEPQVHVYEVDSADPGCTGLAEAFDGTRYIAVSVPPGCFDSPAVFALRALMVYGYNNADGGLGATDQAPSDPGAVSGPIGRAEPAARVLRLAAGDNVAAAIALSEATLPDGGARVALVARDDTFADALAGGPLQGRLWGPLLLTSRDGLDPRVAGELQRLGVESVIILGGPVAVSDTVRQDLEARGLDTSRLWGPSRLETAVAVTEAYFAGAPAALLARAFPAAGETDPTQAFADALAGGAWGAAGGLPLLLTESERLSASTAQHLTARRGVVSVVGGAAAVSDQVLTDLQAMGILAERVAGVDRFGTAVAVARAQGSYSAQSANRVLLVEGQAAGGWVPGFAAAAHSAAAAPAPVLLANGDSLPAATEQYLLGADPDRPPVLVCAPYTTAAACDAALQAIAAGRPR